MVTPYTILQGQALCTILQGQACAFPCPVCLVVCLVQALSCTPLGTILTPSLLHSPKAVILGQANTLLKLGPKMTRPDLT